MSDLCHFPSLWRASFTRSCEAALLPTNVPSFHLSENIFISPSVLKGISQDQNFSLFFVSQPWKYLTPSSSGWHHFWDVKCSSYLCSSIGKVSIPPPIPGFFQDFFFLALTFWHLNMICLGVVFLSFVVFFDLASCELPGSVVWCLTLIWGKFSGIIAVSIASDFF